MLSGQQITFATITAGPAIGLVFWVWFKAVCNRWSMPINMALGMIANGMSVVPLACIIFNIVCASFYASFPANAAQTPVQQAALTSSMAGTETTIFLALLYALFMSFYMFHKSMQDMSRVVP
ncbi:hypothetical protein [Rhizobium leguminosarum]|uniref:hypothetical protein n=1 Tax=Rhizobium leguminosarum TaxID=384 RepID=UPI0014418AC8|nr:hypothetical protein [Rhizobium leguminosarum]NKK81727.1 hypothetical protein [Rhizobium leguminosarum bv. viciae]